jgi:glycosyltransferase involved in cell wall biosynthesis
MDNVRALVSEAEAVDLAPLDPAQIETFQQTGRNLKSLVNLTVSTFKKLRRERPDVVHLHSTYAGMIGRMVCIAARLVAPEYRPLVVYTPHAWAFLMRSGAVKQKLYALVERALLLLTDAVICVSAFEKEEARRRGLPSERLAVIHNGVPVPEIMPQRAVSDTRRLLFVGRLDEQKGFDTALAIMDKLAESGAAARLTVVGAAMYGGSPPPQRLDVTYTGWIPASEVPAHFAQNDVLLLPSRWEGFPMGPLEAMAHGLPVLASDVCSLPEIVEDGQTGRLAPADDAGAFADILESTPRQVWAAMGYRARERILEKFTAQQMTDRTLALYEAALG